MSAIHSIQDKSLLQGLQNKDRKAQKWLFEKLNRRMFALCNRYIPDPFQAEDVMMSGFLMVFSRVDQFQESGSFEGWIRRIMVTQSLQFLRKSRSMEVIRYDVEEHSELETEETISSALEYEVLMKLVQRLPMGYRMVFNLFAIEGFTHPEIAGMLQISEGASKSQLFKARVLLQQWIREINQEEKLKAKGS